jgi:hypothetical protein
MGATNFDAIAVPAGGTITVGGSPVGGLAAIGKGTTPDTGWTPAVAPYAYVYKDVTVTNAAAGDVVICTLNAPPFSLLSSVWKVHVVFGYVTGANTVRFFYSRDQGGASWWETGSSFTTIPGTVSYILFRPS